jgi:molecular chaperone HtpG
MKAIWARPKDEVTEEQYTEFYKHLTHDWSDPLEHVLVHVEGTVEARALLYIPSKAPFDLFMREGERRGVQLYVKRVFIMDDWEALLPPWLRFVRGVVASDDLSLNVSREILQKDRQIQAIRKHLTRRLLGVLKEIKEQRLESYRKFWPVFGAVLKEGLLGFDENQDRILELALATSTSTPGEPTSLGDYVGRMKEGQDAIYYITGATQSAAERSPHLEAFKAKGLEVLFFTEPIDELWLRMSREFSGKKLVSVATAASTADVSDEEAKRTEEDRKEREESMRDLLDLLRARLQDHVKDVRLSSRLTESPACLVGNPGDLSPHLRELFRRSGQNPPATKRTLELNPSHPIMARLRELHVRDNKDPKLALYADLLFGQALLAEGAPLPDPAAFSRRVAELMATAD